jgi:hypothetical protein
VRSSLPTELPTQLPEYAPGRIVPVPVEAWPRVFAAGFERHGVHTSLPRFGLDLRTLRVDVDPDRVRAAVSPTTTRPLAERRVSIAHHAGVLWVAGGHTALAANLAMGVERIPIQLVRPLALTEGYSTTPVWDAGGPRPEGHHEHRTPHPAIADSEPAA